MEIIDPAQETNPRTVQHATINGAGLVARVLRGIAVKFQDYLDEQMRDPEFRFWWHVYAPQFWFAEIYHRLVSRLNYFTGRTKHLMLTEVDYGYSLTRPLGATLHRYRDGSFIVWLDNDLGCSHGGSEPEALANLGALLVDTYECLEEEEGPLAPHLEQQLVILRALLVQR